MPMSRMVAIRRATVSGDPKACDDLHQRQLPLRKHLAGYPAVAKLDPYSAQHAYIRRSHPKAVNEQNGIVLVEERAELIAPSNCTVNGPQVQLVAAYDGNRKAIGLIGLKLKDAPAVASPKDL